MPIELLSVLGKNILGGYGDKPEVPTWKPVDVEKEQQASIQGNINALPLAGQFTSQYNKMSVGQLQSMLNAMMPGYSGMAEQTGKNLSSQLKGELPADVVNRIQDSAAARAIGGGFGGSGAHGNLGARDLGLTSLQVSQQAMDSASRWMALNAQAAQPYMLNASNMFITPQQRIATTFQNKANEFNVQWMKNQISAMPNPFDQAMGNAFETGMIGPGEIVGGLLGSATTDSMGNSTQYKGGVSFSGSGGGGDGGGGGIGAVGAIGSIFCWVAREVYGEDNPKWLAFRVWLLTRAPKWFRNLYIKYGERFAQWLKGKDMVKSAIRMWMDSRISTLA